MIGALFPAPSFRRPASVRLDILLTCFLLCSARRWPSPRRHPSIRGFHDDSGYALWLGGNIDSGLKLLGRRYYDSRTGRFISQDPAGDGDNWYAYCGNDPMNAADPEGQLLLLCRRRCLRLCHRWSQGNCTWVLGRGTPGAEGPDRRGRQKRETEEGQPRGVAPTWTGSRRGRPPCLPFLPPCLPFLPPCLPFLLLLGCS